MGNMTSFTKGILLLAASMLLCSPVFAARRVQRPKPGKKQTPLGNSEIRLVRHGKGFRVLKGSWVKAKYRLDKKSGVRVREYELLNGRELGAVVGEMFSIPNVGTWKLTQGNLKAINDALTPKKSKATRKTRAPGKPGTGGAGKNRAIRQQLGHEAMGERWDATFKD
jgi:hypothetical protein